MIRDQIKSAIDQALAHQADDLHLNSPEIEIQGLLNVERPRHGTFGDYAINVSPLAKYARKAPPQIASQIMDQLGNHFWETSVAGGFINLQISPELLTKSLIGIAKTEKPGQNQVYSSLHCLLEFVSANPTGPLHIGHGRWVALGDSLGRLMRHCGAAVTNEFYINDAGSQMRSIANSIWYRALEILGTGGKLPEPQEGQPYPFYPGEYVIEMAQEFLTEHKDQVLAWDNPEHVAPEAALTELMSYSKTSMLAKQKALMERCRLTFDVWFSEQTLHQAGQVKQVIQTLQERGFTYEKDGALWFASSRLGDDQDRVLIKSDGSYTYLTADIAYHENKFQRDNGFYNLMINIWGADHHGYIPRMKAAVAALGYNPDYLEILLGQLVNLIIDGEKTRMGKRKKMMTLEDLVDEVGVDAVRFWMVSKSQDTTLDFNVELAASASDENPVFYVQYAHARCASILRNAFQPRLDTLTQETKPPLLQEPEWQDFLAQLSPESMADLLDGIENEPAKQALRELILKLDGFQDKVLDAVRQRSPHTIARYSQDVAADFHRFYNVCRILVSDPAVAKKRLVVIYALKKVLAQALELLGVSAPEQM